MGHDTPASFVLRYLREREALIQASTERSAPFRNRYFSETYLDRFNQSRATELMYRTLFPPVVLAVEAKDGKVIVKTAEPLGESLERRLYVLIATTAGWRIQQRGWECAICGGTGVEEYGTCGMCKGKGWKIRDSD